MKKAKYRQILRAAEALVGRGRFHEITMDEVARKAGVGKGTIYRYFKDKDALFFELAMSGYDELADMIRAQRRRSSDFRACLVNVCRCISDFYRGRRQLMHMMHSEERRATWRRGQFRELFMERRKMLEEAVCTVLDEGRGAGLLRHDIPLPVLASFMLSVLRMRARSRHSGDKADIGYDTVVELFLHGAGSVEGGTSA
jgi:AcrR family transcriptional regulator